MTGDLDIWRRILHTAQAIETSSNKQLNVTPNAREIASSSTDAQIAVPSLPPPLSIYSELLGTDLPPSVAQDLSDSYMSAGTKLQCSTQENLRVTCARLFNTRAEGLSSFEALVTKVFGTFKVNYQRTLAEWTDTYISRARESVAKSSNKSSQDALQSKSNSRQSFNHYYVPLLEHYFAENPLPTHADKNFLAKKCGMTFRQIHVWFQNRRNRTRKEGQVFKRKPQHEPAKLPLDTLFAKMPHSVIPEDQRVPFVDSDEEEFEWHYESSDDDVSGWSERHPRDSDAVDVFEKPAPHYAFPNTYPPEDYLFPEDWEPSFPPPQWERRPATNPTKRSSPVDFDELVELFSRMSVKETPRKHRRKKIPQDPRKPAKPRRICTPPPKPDRSAATIFITTKPLSAPLSARIPPTSPPRKVFLAPRIPTVRAPSRKRAFDSSDPKSAPITLASSPEFVAKQLALSRQPTSKETTPSRRKVAPLPRRVPKGTSIAHRDLNSSPSVTSTPEQTPSSSSRTASSDSSPSKRFRFSSDSSSASELATPESISQPLPIPRLAYDSSSDLSDLFCGSPGNPSQVKGLQLALPTSFACNEGSAGKIPTDFDFERIFSGVTS